MSDRSPLYLLDGSTYIFRAYHAIGHLSNKEGTPTNAVFGVTNMLIKFLRETKPEYFAVVFDAGGKSFRNEVYPDYKANRPPAPEDLVPQFPLVRKAVEALGIAQIEAPGFEADDIMATFAVRGRELGRPVVLISSDKDLMQLVGDGVSMVDPMKENKEYDREAVREKWGVYPESMIDLQALMGDSSDNVPGVPKVGPKTAAKLIDEHGSLDGVYANVESMKKSKLKENLIAFKDQAYLSRDLVALKTDLEIKFDPESFRLREVAREETVAFFEAMNFQRLAQTYLGSDGDPSEASQSQPVSYRLINDRKSFDDLLKKLKKAQRFAFDLETTSLDPTRASLVGLSFSWKANEACYVPVAHTGLGVKQLAREEVVEALAPILADESKIKVGQNIKYDMIVSAQHGMPVGGSVVDTMVLSYLIDSGRRSHGMDALARELLDLQTIPYKEVTGTGKKQIGFEEVELDAACRYAAEDADVTWRLAEILEPQLKEEGLEKIYATLEEPLIGVLVKMERDGVQIDAKTLRDLSEEYRVRLGALETRIHEEAGEPFNILSTQQLGAILFEKLELPTGRKTKTRYSTDSEVLEGLREAHPIPGMVLEYRQLSKLKSTYADALIAAAHPETGRVHTSFNQTVAATGRLSSSDPNLQNIPIRTEEGRKIREAFVAPAGKTLVGADYSQIELRVMAHLSEEPLWVEGFAADLDIHRRTASEIWDVPLDEVSDELRSDAKAINFGILYGMSPFGLANALGIDQKTAASYIEDYFGQYPEVRRTLDEFVEFAETHGYVETLLGRKCRIGGLKSKNHNIRQMGRRNAINYPVQGSAADIIKKAMIDLDREISTNDYPMKMVLQVHDELLVETDEGFAEEAEKILVETMENAVELKVPITVSAKSGKTWGEAHG